MMNPFEMLPFLHDELPEIDNEVRPEETGSPFLLMRALGRLTSKKVDAGEMRAAQKCMRIAERMHEKGNQTIRNAVLNVFVFSLTGLCNQYPTRKKQLLSMMPIGISTAYYAQLSHAGC